jgi:hypothetical protein
MAGYVDRVISDAERSNAPAVVFYMDTPGGLSDAMRDINLRILSSKVPVVVYVAPNGARAGSAGVYISYAAHLVGMAPTLTNISATPVAMDQNGGEAQMSPEMKNKVTNDAVAGIRALAEQRGRDPDFAERAVREGANLQATEALRTHVVNYIAGDLNDLLRQMDGAQVQLGQGSEQGAHRRRAHAPCRHVRARVLPAHDHQPDHRVHPVEHGQPRPAARAVQPGPIFPRDRRDLSAAGVLRPGHTAAELRWPGVDRLRAAPLRLEPFLTAHGIPPRAAPSHS